MFCFTTKLRAYEEVICPWLLEKVTAFTVLILQEKSEFQWDLGMLKFELEHALEVFDCHLMFSS